jgi:hypothetical protein
MTTISDVWHSKHLSKLFTILCKGFFDLNNLFYSGQSSEALAKDG